MCLHLAEPTAPVPVWNPIPGLHYHLHYIETVTITYQIEVDVWT
jgi:hypothetical protein